jgi:hypothetical protein
MHIEWWVSGSVTHHLFSPKRRVGKVPGVALLTRATFANPLSRYRVGLLGCRADIAFISSGNGERSEQLSIPIAIGLISPPS